jgi:hypothetical protein
MEKKLSQKAKEILSRCEEVLSKKEVEQLNKNYKSFLKEVQKRLEK